MFRYRFQRWSDLYQRWYGGTANVTWDFILFYSGRNQRIRITSNETGTTVPLP